jgi:hypothetical protein
MPFNDFLINAAFSIPFCFLAVYFFVKGISETSRFFHQDSSQNPSERLRDNILSNVYLTLGAACLAPALTAFLVGIQDFKSYLFFTLTMIVLSVFIFPIGIAGSYFRSYQIHQLWGGLIPEVRARSDFSQSERTHQTKIDY